MGRHYEFGILERDSSDVHVNLDHAGPIGDARSVAAGVVRGRGRRAPRGKAGKLRAGPYECAPWRRPGRQRPGEAWPQPRQHRPGSARLQVEAGELSRGELQLRRQPRPSPRAVQSAGEGVGARARGPERRRGGGRRSSSSCIAGDMADLKEQRRSVEVTGGGVGVCGGTHTRGLAPAHGRYTRPARETGQQPHHQFDRTTPNLGIRIIFHKRIE